MAQLSAQCRLEHPAHELGDQSARTGDLLRRQTLQRVLEGVRRQQSCKGPTRRPAPSRASLVYDLLLGHALQF
jgi:hypothetical protein